MKKDEDKQQIALFRGKNIRKVIYQKEWWFSVVDVCGVLTESFDAGAYWRKLKQRLSEESNEPVTNCHGLKLLAPDGKIRKTDCANTEGLFRIIQSIPSPKAEPFKRWLAKVGYERTQEIKDPELTIKRTKLLYKLKGYSEDWIEKRIQGIVVRDELTNEWQKRGAQERRDYEILTNEIAQATFDLKPSEHKKLKGLKNENLRDHMGNLELVLTMLGEATTTEIHRTNDTQGVPRLKDDARIGGQIAGSARKQIERKIDRPVVSSDNFLSKKNKKKLK